MDKEKMRYEIAKEVSPILFDAAEKLFYKDFRSLDDKMRTAARIAVFYADALIKRLEITKELEKDKEQLPKRGDKICITWINPDNLKRKYKVGDIFTVTSSWKNEHGTFVRTRGRNTPFRANSTSWEIISDEQ